MNSTVITFRGHKNLKSWIKYAANGFEGEGELIRLILTKAALDQGSESGVSSFMKSILNKNEITVGIGDTAVFGVRLSAEVGEMIRACAAKMNKTVSEWCFGVMLLWHQYFSQLYQKFNKDQGQAWLPQHGVEFRARVAESLKVYAQKTGKTQD